MYTNHGFISIKNRTYAVAGVWSRFCLPFDCAQDERQHGTSHPLVFGFSALCAEKLNTNKRKYRSAEGKNSPLCNSCNVSSMTASLGAAQHRQLYNKEDEPWHVLFTSS